MRPSTGRALLHYLVTGGLAAIVDITGFTLLSYIGTPVIPAAAGSFGIATVVNFLLTSHWVFRTRPTAQRYAAFLIGALFGLLVNVAVTYLCVTYLQLPRPLAKTVAIGTTFLVNFWINARVVFRAEPT